MTEILKLKAEMETRESKILRGKEAIKEQNESLKRFLLESDEEKNELRRKVSAMKTEMKLNKVEYLKHSEDLKIQVDLQQSELRVMTREKQRLLAFGSDRLNVSPKIQEAGHTAISVKVYEQVLRIKEKLVNSEFKRED